jgi:opacity protein-like surface antigen
LEKIHLTVRARHAWPPPVGGKHALVGLWLVDRDRLSSVRGRLRRFLAAGVAGRRAAGAAAVTAVSKLERRLWRRAGRRRLSRRRLSRRPGEPARERDFPGRDSEFAVGRVAGHAQPAASRYQRPELWRVSRLQLADRRHGVRRGAQCQPGLAPSKRLQLGTRSYVVTSGGNIYAPTIVNVTSAATVDMSDYFTARGRLGWAFGDFLPYLVAGVSLAQIDSSRHVSIEYTGFCVPQPNVTCVDVGGSYPFDNISHGKYVLGFDAALGMDYMLTRNVFARGETEYLQLGTPNNIKLNTVSARIALGLRY